MKRAPDHTSRTLKDLEGDRWGPPPPDATRLVATCHALRIRPVESLGDEDLRLLIGQGIGRQHLIPLALELLRLNPLAPGDLYDGALLQAVLSTDHGYWKAHPGLAAHLRTIIADLDPPPSHLATVITAFLEASQ